MIELREKGTNKTIAYIQSDEQFREFCKIKEPDMEFYNANDCFHYAHMEYTIIIHYKTGIPNRMNLLKSTCKGVYSDMSSLNPNHIVSHNWTDWVIENFMDLVTGRFDYWFDGTIDGDLTEFELDYIKMYWDNEGKL
jgi:hypothetical protein